MVQYYESNILFDKLIDNIFTHLKIINNCTVLIQRKKLNYVIFRSNNMSDKSENDRTVLCH